MAPLAGHVPFFIRMFHAYHIRAQVWAAWAMGCIETASGWCC